MTRLAAPPSDAVLGQPRAARGQSQSPPRPRFGSLMMCATDAPITAFVATPDVESATPEP